MRGQVHPRTRAGRGPLDTSSRLRGLRRRWEGPKRSPPHIPYLSQPFIKSKKTNVEVPEHGASRVWEGSERSRDGFSKNTLGRRKVPRGTKDGSQISNSTANAQNRPAGQRCRQGRLRKYGRPERWWRGDSASVSGGIRWTKTELCQNRSRRES